MDQNTRDFLNLIRNSQFGDVSFPNLTDIDWNYMYTEGINQAVLGLISTQVPKEIIEKDPRWKQAIYRQTVKYINYAKAEADLVKLLDEAGIPYVILKGNASAMYYKDSTKRQMGDIDFLVPQNQFTKAKELLLKDSYKEIINEVPNPRHIEFKKNGIVLELHQRFSYTDVDIEKYITVGFNARMNYSIDSHSFSALSKLANGIVLLEHIREHLKSALGLRQIIDWMMYVNKELDDTFWHGEFQKVAHDTGMEKLAIAVTRMCQLYLGLPNSITWCNTAETTLCQKFMYNILCSGNFGSKTRSGGKIENATIGFHRNGFFRHLQKRGEHNWKAYKKHHWLKPFAWFYQIIRYLILGLKSKRSLRQLISDDTRGKQRSQLLNELEI